MAHRFYPAHVFQRNQTYDCHLKPIGGRLVQRGILVQPLCYDLLFAKNLEMIAFNVQSPQVPLIVLNPM